MLALSVTEPRPNLFADRFSVERDGLRGESVVRAAGAEQLGGTLYELAPGHEGIPLHVHHGMEELAVVVLGHPTLRTLEDESVLEPGDVVAFPRGRRGAHTLANRGPARPCCSRPVRVSIASSSPRTRPIGCGCGSGVQTLWSRRATSPGASMCAA